MFTKFFRFLWAAMLVSFHFEMWPYTLKCHRPSSFVQHFKHFYESWYWTLNVLKIECQCIKKMSSFYISQSGSGAPFSTSGGTRSASLKFLYISIPFARTMFLYFGSESEELNLMSQMYTIPVFMRTLWGAVLHDLEHDSSNMCWPFSVTHLRNADSSSTFHLKIVLHSSSNSSV